MIWNVKSLFMLVIASLSVSLPVQAAEKFIIDDYHSYVQYRIKHSGFSTQSGKWFVKGSIELDKDNPKNSKVSITIDVASIVTGIPELDKHLKSKIFFDVEHYPTATFVSTNVDPKSSNTAQVTGNLTLHGVTKPVTLRVTLNKDGKNPINDRTTVGFTATTEIKRSDFGMKTLVPEVDDDVVLEIAAEAYQPKS